MDYESHNSVWPPLHWCKIGQMVLLQAVTIKNPGSNPPLPKFRSINTPENTSYPSFSYKHGVVWNREQNVIYASPHQWAVWREMHHMSRAYITQGKPLFDELKALFAPNDDLMMMN
ncbi:hypothetical protein ACS0TY_013327 [Phlomoides rotata]